MNLQCRNEPVVAIPPSYNQDGSLELDSTAKYLNYLKSRNATCVMSTAGTSQFNFMGQDEIHNFNRCLSESFEGSKILGIPAVNTGSACDLLKMLNLMLEKMLNLWRCIQIDFIAMIP